MITTPEQPRHRLVDSNANQHAPHIGHATIADDVARALEEDVGHGDLTAQLLPVTAMARARVITREDAVLCGRAWFETCFHALDASTQIHWHASDGDRVSAGDTLCEIDGTARTLVTAERSALNFLQLLSAVATVTHRHVLATAGTHTRILDTRKTIPGLRRAQKYAVLTGGGCNHRLGLFDAVLIKENHIIAAGSLRAAVSRARELHPEALIETEVETFAELEEALAAGADQIMLDEFAVKDLPRAVALAGGRIPLEVSGGVELDGIASIAATGVDFISVGALTKNVQAIDLSMRITMMHTDPKPPR